MASPHSEYAQADAAQATAPSQSTEPATSPASTTSGGRAAPVGRDLLESAVVRSSSGESVSSGFGLTLTVESQRQSLVDAAGESLYEQLAEDAQKMGVPPSAEVRQAAFEMAEQLIGGLFDRSQAEQDAQSVEALAEVVTVSSVANRHQALLGVLTAAQQGDSDQRMSAAAWLAGLPESPVAAVGPLPQHGAMALSLLNDKSQKLAQSVSPLVSAAEALAGFQAKLQGQPTGADLRASFDAIQASAVELKSAGPAYAQLSNEMDKLDSAVKSGSLGAAVDAAQGVQVAVDATSQSVLAQAHKQYASSGVTQALGMAEPHLRQQIERLDAVFASNEAPVGTLLSRLANGVSELPGVGGERADKLSAESAARQAPPAPTAPPDREKPDADLVM